MAPNSRTHPRLDPRRRSRAAMDRTRPSSTIGLLPLEEVLRRGGVLRPDVWMERYEEALLKALSENPKPTREAAGEGEANSTDSGSQVYYPVTLHIYQRAGCYKAGWSRTVAWLIIVVAIILLFTFVAATVKALASLIMPVWRIGCSVWNASEIFRPM